MSSISILNDWQDHIGSLLFVAAGSMQFVSFLGHLVDQIETPKSQTGRLLLWSIKWWVGQRLSAVNAKNGMQTAMMPITDEQKTALQNGSELRVVKKSEPTDQIPAGAKPA